MDVVWLIFLPVDFLGVFVFRLLVGLAYTYTQKNALAMANDQNVALFINKGKR